MINNIGALLLTTALVASCNQEEQPSASGQKEVVKITASIGAEPGSRVTRTEDNYAFGQGDAFHIVGWYGESANPDTWFNDAVCTYSDTQWTAQPMLYWQNGENLTHHFLAWYPTSFADSKTTKLDAIPFELSGDEEKDDVLYAKWSDTQPSNNTLPLTFDHLMARFDLNLVFNSEDYPTTPTDISAQIEVVNTATINLLADSPAFTPGSTKTEVSLTGIPAEGMAWSGYTVVIPEQNINACKVTLSFTADGEQKLTYTHGESLLFQSGKRTVLNLTVNKIEGLVGVVPDSDDSEFLN